jgi:hypothetical protein
MTQSDHAYLSVLSWPDGFTEAQKIEALVMAAALDLHQAKLATRRSTPGVICSIDTIIANDVLRVLHELGILALAPTQTQFARYPEPEQPNSVEAFPEKELAAFAVRTRDGGAWTFQAPELKMVVFGRARNSTTRINSSTSSGSSYASFGTSGIVAEIATSGDDAPKYDRSMSVKPMLDLHIEQSTPSGIKPRLIRLIGGRTRIGLIGDGDPRPSLLEKSDPIKKLRELAPDARYELGFDSFSPPVDTQYRAIHGGCGSHRLSMEAFSFYSVWVALMNEMMNG